MTKLSVTLNYCDKSADVAFLYGLTILNVVFHCTWTFKISVVSRQRCFLGRHILCFRYCRVRPASVIDAQHHW
jgi:hypothetical protein